MMESDGDNALAMQIEPLFQIDCGGSKKSE